MNENRIEKPLIELDEDGKIKRVYVVFGPHYFIDIMPNESGKLTLYLGATHHGFNANATEVGGELEKVIYEIREAHPELTID